MTDHGNQSHASHALQLIDWTQRHYPWSVLWILFMVGIATLVAGRVIPTLVVAALIIIVLLHSARLRREDRRRQDWKG